MSETTVTVDKIDSKFIESKYPGVFSEVKSIGYSLGVDEGLKEGHKAGHIEGFKAGAEAERKRIMEIEANSMSGHEELVKQLKFDGKTTGPEAAVQILKAEKEKKGKILKQIETNSPSPIPPSNTDGQQFSGIDKNLPVEDRAKQEWDKSGEIRAEFGTVQSYTAYLRAAESGRARILKR